jgi:hypothetical protein
LATNSRQKPLSEIHQTVCHGCSLVKVGFLGCKESRTAAACLQALTCQVSFMMLLLQAEGWLSIKANTMKDSTLTQAAAVANPATDLC